MDPQTINMQDLLSAARFFSAASGLQALGGDEESVCNYHSVGSSGEGTNGMPPTGAARAEGGVSGHGVIHIPAGTGQAGWRAVLSQYSDAKGVRFQKKDLAAGHYLATPNSSVPASLDVPVQVYLDKQFPFPVRTVTLRDSNYLPRQELIMSLAEFWDGLEANTQGGHTASKLVVAILKSTVVWDEAGPKPCRGAATWVRDHFVVKLKPSPQDSDDNMDNTPSEEEQQQCQGQEEDEQGHDSGRIKLFNMLLGDLSEMENEVLWQAVQEIGVKTVVEPPRGSKQHWIIRVGSKEITDLNKALLALKEEVTKRLTMGDNPQYSPRQHAQVLQIRPMKRKAGTCPGASDEAGPSSRPAAPRHTSRVRLTFSPSLPSGGAEALMAAGVGEPEASAPGTAAGLLGGAAVPSGAAAGPSRAGAAAAPSPAWRQDMPPAPPSPAPAGEGSGSQGAALKDRLAREQEQFFLLRERDEIAAAVARVKQEQQQWQQQHGDAAAALESAREAEGAARVLLNQKQQARSQVAQQLQDLRVLIERSQESLNSSVIAREEMELLRGLIQKWQARESSLAGEFAAIEAEVQDARERHQAGQASSKLSEDRLKELWSRIGFLG